MRLQGLDTELEQTVALVLGCSQEMVSTLAASLPVVLRLLPLVTELRFQVRT